MAARAKKKKVRRDEMLSLTISPTELGELRSRHQLKFNAQQAYRAAVEFQSVYQRQIAKAYSLPEKYEVDMTTGLVTWRMTPGERMRRSN